MNEAKIHTIVRLMDGEYTDLTKEHFAVFLAGERPAASLSVSDGDWRTVSLIDEMVPYDALYLPRIRAVLFFHEDQESIRRLQRHGCTMDETEYHRQVGRALGYPWDAIEWFLTMDEPSMTLARLVALDLLKDGRISSREVELLNLIPYAPAPSTDSVLEGIERGRRYQSVLDSIGLF